jgi:hypothetical protein
MESYKSPDIQSNIELPAKITKQLEEIENELKDELIERVKILLNACSKLSGDLEVYLNVILNSLTKKENIIRSEVTDSEFKFDYKTVFAEIFKIRTLGFTGFNDPNNLLFQVQSKIDQIFDDNVLNQGQKQLLLKLQIEMVKNISLSILKIIEDFENLVNLFLNSLFNELLYIIKGIQFNEIKQSNETDIYSLIQRLYDIVIEYFELPEYEFRRIFENALSTTKENSDTNQFVTICTPIFCTLAVSLSEEGFDSIEYSSILLLINIIVLFLINSDSDYNELLLKRIIDKLKLEFPLKSDKLTELTRSVDTTNT